MDAESQAVSAATNPLIAGRYEVLGVLGEGGMGEVLLARDLRLEMEVAIKRIPAHLARARLNDPRIVRLFDLADTQDELLLVLEYVRGPSLQEVLRARRAKTGPRSWPPGPCPLISLA
jgi:serine/threonine protein kinase